MKTEETTQSKKKVYQSPELKNLGKIGEVTNTIGSGSYDDGGAGPMYSS